MDVWPWSEQDAESRRERNRTDKISGRDACRISFSSAAQRINTPGYASSQHQDRTSQRRSGKTGEYKTDKSSGRDDEADNLDRVQPFAFVQSPENHRSLNRSKQKQCAGSGCKRDIGEQKASRVSE